MNDLSSFFEHLDEFEHKHLFDNIRAVDLLKSLDFVDTQRIGAVGHSMGSGDVFDLMAIDQRVKVGILSGDGMGDPAAAFLPLISPRLYIGIRGEFDGSPESLLKTREMHANARPFYVADGAGENLILLTAKMGHWFGDKLKWTAYKRLKEYFAVLPPRTFVDLSELVLEAREASRWLPEEEQEGMFLKPKVRGNYTVLANREEIVSALAGLFLHLSDQVSKVELCVAIEEEPDNYVVVCRVSTDRIDPGDYEGSSYETLREVERILAEHDTALIEDHSPSELRYRISFPKEQGDKASEIQPRETGRV